MIQLDIVNPLGPNDYINADMNGLDIIMAFVQRNANDDTPDDSTEQMEIDMDKADTESTSDIESEDDMESASDFDNKEQSLIDEGYCDDCVKYIMHTHCVACERNNQLARNHACANYDDKDCLQCLMSLADALD